MSWNFGKKNRFASTTNTNTCQTTPAQTRGLVLYLLDGWQTQELQFNPFSSKRKSVLGLVSQKWFFHGNLIPGSKLFRLDMNNDAPQAFFPTWPHSKSPTPWPAPHLRWSSWAMSSWASRPAHPQWAISCSVRTWTIPAWYVYNAAVWYGPSAPYCNNQH